MSAGALVLLTMAVMAAGGVQRLTGLGFTLVAAPVTVLVLGPWDGITLMFLLGTGSCIVAAWQTRDGLRDVRAARLCASAFVGVVPGVAVAYVASDRGLGVVVAVTTLVALLLVVAMPRLRWSDGPGLQFSSGFTCGALGGLAGTGGPPLVLYGAVTETAAEDLIPLMQATFSVVGLEALLLRGVISGSPLPDLSAGVWVILAIAVIAGDRLGAVLAYRVTDVAARVGMILVAGAGSIALLVRSVTS